MESGKCLKVNDSLHTLLVPRCQRDLETSKLSLFVSLLKTNKTNITNITNKTNKTINTNILDINKKNLSSNSDFLIKNNPAGLCEVCNNPSEALYLDCGRWKCHNCINPNYMSLSSRETPISSQGGISG